jgi:hypothetical protein
LTPRSRAHAPPLRFALACGRVDGRERRPGPTPVSSRRASPLTGNAAAAHSLYASWAVRSRADGQDRVPLRFKWGGPPWTRAPGARRGPPRPRESVAVGSEIHGAGLAVLIKSPWKFLNSKAGPS